MYVTLCAVGLQWYKMNRKCPEHPSSSLLTTAAERNKVSTGCYFFACLVFSPHDVNVFVTDFILDNAVTYMQGFSSGILMILFEKLCLKCEGIWINMWLPYTVNVQNVVARHCKIFEETGIGAKNCATCSTVHILHILPYTFYHTHFHTLQRVVGTVRG